MTQDIKQLIRHYRFKETILIKLPTHPQPFEAIIHKMTNDGQYANLGGGMMPYWVNTDDVVVLAVLKTPNPLAPEHKPKGLGSLFDGLNARADHSWDGGAI